MGFCGEAAVIAARIVVEFEMRCDD
jgi:hypothetical protein